MDVPTIRVHYRALRNEYVFHPFYTMEGALEFIHNNALVYPLPGVYVTEVVSWTPFEEVEIPI